MIELNSKYIKILFADFEILGILSQESVILCLSNYINKVSPFYKGLNYTHTKTLNHMWWCTVSCLPGHLTIVSLTPFDFLITFYDWIHLLAIWIQGLVFEINNLVNSSLILLKRLHLCSLVRWVRIYMLWNF